MREYLGDGYVTALRKAWEGDVPESADFVMFWWEKAAELVRAGKVQRFGFITTNCIHQTFNRRVLEKHLGAEKTPLILAYAIPDHPWVDSTDGAAVRIAMTVGSLDDVRGDFNRVIDKIKLGDGEVHVELESGTGIISSQLRVGADLAAVSGLAANNAVCSTGLILGGRGFIISRKELERFEVSNPRITSVVGPRWNGRDVVDRHRNEFVVDVGHLSEGELRSELPEIFQHLKDSVFPERQTNRDEKLQREWWRFRRANSEVRGAMDGLQRFFVTPETAKHRFLSS